MKTLMTTLRLYMGLKQVRSSSMRSLHSLIQFKVVQRAHISKVKLAQMFPGSNPMRNRWQCAEGTFIYMFWTCPKFGHFMAFNI